MKKILSSFLLLAGFSAHAEVQYIEDIMAKALEEESDIAKVFESIELAAMKEKKGAYKVTHVAAQSPFSKQGIRVGDILFAKDE